MTKKQDDHPAQENFRGVVGIGKDLEAGRDPNADLDKTPKDERKNQTEAAVAMRIAGASYESIAKTLEYANRYRARAAVERALAASAQDDSDREKQRVLHARRLDRLLQSVMGKAVNPRDPEHLAYNGRALAILDRYSRLHGLDAPTQSVVYTPSSEKIEEYVAKFTVLARQDAQAEEADIIDAEIDEEAS